MRFFIIFFLLFPVSVYSLTLKEAVNLAVKNNPVINQQRINIEIQKEKTLQAKRTRFGEFSGLAMFNKYDSNRNMQPLDRRHLAEDILSTGIEYQVPVFTGFELTENIKISKLSEKLNVLSKGLAKNQIIFNVKSVYYKILSLKKQMSAMESYKNSLNQLLENVSLMVKTGKKPEVDLYKIQYDVKSVDAVIENLKNSINTLKFALKELIGKKEVNTDKIEDIVLTKNFKPIKPELENLASVKSVNTKKSISEENIKKSKSEYYPKIFLNSNTFENYGNGDDVNTWQISLNLKMNIFDFGKRESKVREAKLEKNKVAFEKIRTILKKEKEITDAINKVKTEESNIEAFKNQVKFAKESERIEKMKYENGVSQIYDYLYAKSRRYLAESKFFDAVYNRELAIAYYDYVTEKNVN